MRRILPLAVIVILASVLFTFLNTTCGGGNFTGSTGNPTGTGTGTSTATGSVVPPLGGSSQGTGGTYPLTGSEISSGGATFCLIVPSSYNPSTPNAFCLVNSGAEGRTTMTAALNQNIPQTGTSSIIFAVLDGYVSTKEQCCAAMDYVRANYNISNDRTYMISESAGTSVGMQVAFDVRQSYFAAYWANDVMCAGAPAKTAAQLGFAPWGNASAGGNFTDADTIVANMKAANYRTPADAPYTGTGYDQHGNPEQLRAAMRFILGKTRQ